VPRLRCSGVLQVKIIILLVLQKVLPHQADVAERTEFLIDPGSIACEGANSTYMCVGIFSLHPEVLLGADIGVILVAIYSRC
jgi:hypothetical protein